MKFKITEEQFSSITEVTAKAKANEQVFLTVLKNYEDSVAEANTTLDEVWDVIVDEHGLDMINHDWIVRKENDYFVVENVIQRQELEPVVNEC